MTVRIRLSRGGSKKHPYYRVVAADQRAPRDGRFIEKLGSYNPLLPQDHQERLVLDVEKVKSWIAKGAQPTERLQKLFANLGICEAPKFTASPRSLLRRRKLWRELRKKKKRQKLLLKRPPLLLPRPLPQPKLRLKRLPKPKLFLFIN